MYREVDGDLIQLANSGIFDVITHGCNCMCQMGAGIAPQMAKAFGCNDFPKERAEYAGDINKLGTIDYELLHFENGERWTKYPDAGGKWATHKLYVVNSYTQYKYGLNHIDGASKPLDYEALTMCMRKINHRFNRLHIGLPKIGAGLAGGDWDRIKKIIQRELTDCIVTVVIYKK
jgi:O-acetyl-ADP-ribose deacetylase (regulator of RNase III)